MLIISRKLCGIIFYFILSTEIEINCPITLFVTHSSTTCQQLAWNSYSESHCLEIRTCDYKYRVITKLIFVLSVVFNFVILLGFIHLRLVKNYLEPIKDKRNCLRGVRFTIAKQRSIVERYQHQLNSTCYPLLLYF